MRLNVMGEVSIARASWVVAAFTTDPARLADWCTGVLAASWSGAAAHDRPSGEIAMTRDTWRGQRCSTWVVTDWVPGQRFVMATVGEPTCRRTSYTWAETASGTHMWLRRTLDLPPRQAPAAPLLRPWLRRSVRVDLAQLKELLEREVGIERA